MKSPLCVFDLFLDLPHPSASPASYRSRVIDPPSMEENDTEHLEPSTNGRRDRKGRAVTDELYEAATIARITRFSFPEHDETAVKVALERTHQMHDSFQSMSMGSLSTSSRSLSSGKGDERGAPRLNRHDMYFQDFMPSHHTFAFQLRMGTRIHGHVRRYLPPHGDAAQRVDVGRRGVRAMVILTRAPGGERFYAAILKTVETMNMYEEGTRQSMGDITRARFFLHALHHQQKQNCIKYESRLSLGSSLNQRRRNPGANHPATDHSLAMVEIHGLEFAEPMEMTMSVWRSAAEEGGGAAKRGTLVSDDCARFQLPLSLQPGFVSGAPHLAVSEDYDSPMLPLLRCVGAAHALRILSALLCQGRIILLSKSATRLSKCVRGASAMLSQGLLIWKHMQIAVLPPKLLHLLSVDRPYLVGLLKHHSHVLDAMDDISDVLCVDVDRNELMTLGMEDPNQTVPDLLKVVATRRRGGRSESLFTESETLAKDLDEIIKADRRNGETSDSGVEATNNKSAEGGGGTGTGTGADAGAAVAEWDQSKRSSGSGGGKKKMALFGALRRSKPTQKEQRRGRKDSSDAMSAASASDSAETAALFGKVMRMSSKSDLHHFDDTSSYGDDSAILSLDSSCDRGSAGSLDFHATTTTSAIPLSSVCDNDEGENAVRAALVTFYLCLYGDMGMFLSKKNGSLVVDPNKFVARKKQMGVREDSSLFWVLHSLVQSSMFLKFVRGRLADVASDRVHDAPHQTPLFVKCERQLRKSTSFTPSHIRKVVHRYNEESSIQNAIRHGKEIKSIAGSLTSPHPYEGDVSKAVHRLLEECRECDGNLSQVMSVLWMRLTKTSRNSGRLLALQLLERLLLHGPITVVAEASDCMGVLRALRSSYRGGGGRSLKSSLREIRAISKKICKLLLHKTHLFDRRRWAAAKRCCCGVSTKEIKEPRWADYLIRRLPLTVGFQHIHVLLRPEEEHAAATGGAAQWMEQQHPSHDAASNAEAAAAAVATARRNDERTTNRFHLDDDDGRADDADDDVDDVDDDDDDDDFDELLDHHHHHHHHHDCGEEEEEEEHLSLPDQIELKPRPPQIMHAANDEWVVDGEDDDPSDHFQKTHGDNATELLTLLSDLNSGISMSPTAAFPVA